MLPRVECDTPSYIPCTRIFCNNVVHVYKLYLNGEVEDEIGAIMVINIAGNLEVVRPGL